MQASSAPQCDRPIDEIPVDPDKIEEDPARIALPVMLDLFQRLPEDRGLFGFGGSMILMRAAVRLLQRIPANIRADTVRAVLTTRRPSAADSPWYALSNRGITK